METCVCVYVCIIWYTVYIVLFDYIIEDIWP